MGVCVKLDKSIGLEEEAYYVIGLTEGFATQEILYAYQNNTKVSKAALLENDKFALLETFKRASLRCTLLY